MEGPPVFLVPRKRVFRTHRRTGLRVPGPVRLRRFELGVTLEELARVAEMTLTRASYAERGMPRAPGDVEALAEAVEKFAAGGAR